MIKYLYCLALISFGLLWTFKTSAQVVLPQASPEAMVKQTIGLTDITLKYHAPGVKGRKIFGSLVPYGQLWRAGANEATIIKFTDDVFLNHERVPAGTYSFFLLPEDENNWNIVLNKDSTLWGLEGYSELDDVAYLRVSPQPNEFQETMQFSFSDIGTNTGYLNLTWENVKVSLHIETEVEKKAYKNIKEALANAAPDDWYIWAQCAEYMLPRKEYHEEALQWINKSIAIKENFYNDWIKAKLYALNSEYQVAANLTAKAIELGKSDLGAYKTYAEEIETSYREWKRIRN